MTIFKQDTREITLPESGAKLTIFTKLTFGSVLESQISLEENDKLSSLKAASLLIKDWDFTDEKENKIEINSENILLLSNVDGQYLISELNKIFQEKKN